MTKCVMRVLDLVTVGNGGSGNGGDGCASDKNMDGLVDSQP